MQFDNVIPEGAGHGGCCERVTEGYKMSILGEAVDDNHDHFIALGRWQVGIGRG